MRQSVTVFTCCLFTAAFLPLAAHAVTLQAWIEGQTKSATSLAGTYTTLDDGSKSYTISAGATLVGPDSSQDYIRFHNIVISSTTHDAVTGHIYFWGDYDPGPMGTVTFKLSANGTITRKVLNVTKAAISSNFSVSGWVQHPTDVVNRPGDGSSGTWTHITYPYNPSPPAYTLNVVCDNVAACGTVNYLTPTPGYQQAGVNSPRIMKGEIWFYLHKKNDKLTLNLNSGVLVQTSGGGGSGGGTNEGEGIGGTTCPQCCCAPCKGEPPLDLLSDKLPNVDRFIYKQVPVPILKEYLNQREKEEMNQTK